MEGKLEAKKQFVLFRFKQDEREYAEEFLKAAMSFVFVKDFNGRLETVEPEKWCKEHTLGLVLNEGAERFTVSHKTLQNYKTYWTEGWNVGRAPYIQLMSDLEREKKEKQWLIDEKKRMKKEAKKQAEDERNRWY